MPFAIGKNKTDKKIAKEKRQNVFRMAFASIIFVVGITSIITIGVDTSGQSASVLEQQKREEVKASLKIGNGSKLVFYDESGTELHSASDKNQIFHSTTFAVEKDKDCHLSCIEKQSACLDDCATSASGARSCQLACEEEAILCRNNCLGGAEIEAFPGMRIRLGQDTKLNIKKFEPNTEDITIDFKEGRAWFNSPKAGELKINLNEGYSVSAKNNASFDLECSPYRCEIYTHYRGLDLSWENEYSSGTYTLLPRQNIKIPLVDVEKFKPNSEIFFTAFSDEWIKARAREDQVRRQIEKISRFDIEPIGFSDKIADQVKKAFTFLILSDEKKIEAKFGDLNTLLEKSAEDLVVGKRNSSYLREFLSFIKENKNLNESGKEELAKYIMNKWEIVADTYPSENLDISNSWSRLFPIKTTLEEAYIIIADDPESDWLSFRENDVMLFEDLMSEFKISEALESLKKYNKEIKSNYKNFKNKGDLIAQIEYIENLLLANELYVYDEFWETIFDLEYFTINQVLTPEEASVFASNLLEQKIIQTERLWTSGERLSASLIAKTISGDYMINEEDEVYFNYLDKNFQKLTKLNSNIKNILTESVKGIIETAENYQIGQEKNYSKITEEDEFTMDYYENYLEYLSGRSRNYERPPNVNDVVNQLSQSLIFLETSQVNIVPGWIELENRTDSKVALADWFITLGEKESSTIRYEFSKTRILDPGEKIIIVPPLDEFILPRQGDSLYLYDSQGNLKYTMSYPLVPKGNTYSLLSEWIEIENRTEFQIDTTGWFLTAQELDESTEIKNQIKDINYFPLPEKETIAPSEKAVYALGEKAINLKEAGELYLYKTYYPQASKNIEYTFFDDVVEIYNNSTKDIDLSSYFLGKNNLSEYSEKYQFIENYSEDDRVLSPNETGLYRLSPETQVVLESEKLYLYTGEELPKLESTLVYENKIKQTEGAYGWAEPTPGKKNVPIPSLATHEQTAEGKVAEKVIINSLHTPTEVEGVVISEVYPYDPYRFRIHDLQLQSYIFDVIYDYDILTFSEIKTDKETMMLIDEILTMQGDTANKDSFTLSNFLLLPTRINQVSMDYIFDGVNTPRPDDNPKKASLQILKNIIIDQLRLREVYLDEESITNCNTSENIPANERYTQCDIKKAWIYDPATNAEINFSLTYNKNTQKATNLVMERENYANFEAAIASVQVRDNILGGKKFLDQADALRKEIANDLKQYEIVIDSDNINYINYDLTKFQIILAGIENPDREQRDTNPIIEFDTKYDIETGEIYNTIFEDGKVLRHRIDPEDMTTIIDIMYKPIEKPAEEEEEAEEDSTDAEETTEDSTNTEEDSTDDQSETE